MPSPTTGTQQGTGPSWQPFRSPLMLDDLTADLMWPRLFRAPVLALSPSRVLMGAFLVLIGVVAISILGTIEAWLGWRGSERSMAQWDAVRGVLTSIPRVESLGMAGSMWIGAALDFPGAAIRAHPLVGTVGFLVVIGLWCVGGGALARSCVCELAGNVRCDWTQALGFAGARWTSLVGAMLVPVVIVSLLAAMCSVGGLVLMRVPGVNLIGALLFGLALVAGVLGVIILSLFMVGHVLLIPAVAADASDAVDSIQRAYSYVLGRPLRYVVYVGLATVQGLVVFGIAAAIVGAAGTFAITSASRWAGDDARLMLTQGQTAAMHGSEAERELLRRAAVEQATEAERAVPTEADAKPVRFPVFGWGARIIEVWFLLLGLIVAGVVVSYIHAASAVVYVLMRRVNDGQDVAEIWQPRERELGVEKNRAAEAVGDAD